jgi:hypothetical protein
VVGKLRAAMGVARQALSLGGAIFFAHAGLRDRMTWRRGGGRTRILGPDGNELMPTDKP